MLSLLSGGLLQSTENATTRTILTRHIFETSAHALDLFLAAHDNTGLPLLQRSGRGSAHKDKGGPQVQRGAPPGQEGGVHQDPGLGGGDVQEVIWLCRPCLTPPHVKC